MVAVTVIVVVVIAGTARVSNGLFKVKIVGVSEGLNAHAEAFDVAKDGQVKGLSAKVLRGETDQNAAVDLVAVAEEVRVSRESVRSQPAGDVHHRPLEDVLRGGGA